MSNARRTLSHSQCLLYPSFAIRQFTNRFIGRAPVGERDVSQMVFKKIRTHPKLNINSVAFLHFVYLIHLVGNFSQVAQSRN